ncbi:MobF family relaxase, partial [Cnuella takakiae]
INPETGKKLTQQNKADRTVGYDFTFDAGKSVSLAYTFGSEEDKEQILNAFRQSVKDTMVEIETGIQTRVRGNKQNEDRETGNLAYGEFIHFTTRPVNGIPDPQLHAHCFTFNATYDEQEQKWKAGQFRQIKQDAPYYEAVFHSNLADRLQALGYQVQRTDNSFELKGINRETIEKYSNRSKEIDEFAKKENITDKKEKSALGAKTRESKHNSLKPEQIISAWQSRLSPDELNTLKNLKAAPANEKKKENAYEAIKFSLDHHLERKSVATDKEILTTAIKSSTGNLTATEIKKAFYADDAIYKVKIGNQTFITTHDALQEENKLISNAYDFKGRFKPINENYQFGNDQLNEQQRNAVTHALTTSDGITIITGKAGTGKTTLMKEVQTGIKESGRQIFAFAPSAEASRIVQRKEGFENAETIAKLLQDKTLQEKIKGSVLWLDEAGMISNKDMNKVLDLAKTANARIILTGDTKQHSSVERGDALRIIQQKADIAPITVSTIQRQKNEQYKEAVHHLSNANTEKGFKKLNSSGAIYEISDHQERLRAIAEDYYKSAYLRFKKKQGKEVLVLSPTHAEGEKLTEQIRNKLKEKKVVDQDERQFRVFRNLQLTAAEKEKGEHYQSGDWLIFHQNIKGIKAGSKYEITGTENNTVHLKDTNGNKASVSTSESRVYNVFTSKTINVSKGDKIRITGNGKTAEGIHLFNGTMYQVNGFDKKGNIKLSNGASLPKDYGTFNLGYVMTSHASQGKTVDKVIISQSSMSFRASSKEQFYVSVSRGRDAVSIYTDDKQDLLQAVSRSAERKAATELINKNGDRLDQAINVSRQNFMRRMRDKAMDAAELLKSKIKKEKGYGRI